MINPSSEMPREPMTDEPLKEFLDFEKIEIEAGIRQNHTSYLCRIKSYYNYKEINLDVRIELPHSDKKLSQIRYDIVLAIHEAINPALLNRSPS
jgi:hypothetical protein